MNPLTPDGATTLSPRQLEALQLSANGMKYSAIASQMNISIGQVANMMCEVHRRFGVDSTGASIACGFRLGLLT